MHIDHRFSNVFSNVFRYSSILYSNKWRVRALHGVFLPIVHPAFVPWIASIVNMRILPIILGFMHKSWNQKTTAFHLDGNVLHQWIRVIWNDLSCRTWNFSVHPVWIRWNSIVWIVDLNFMTWPNVLSAEISTSSLGVRRTVKLAETPNPTAACKPWKRIDWSTVVTGYLARNSVWIMMIDNDDFHLPHHGPAPLPMLCSCQLHGS